MHTPSEPTDQHGAESLEMETLRDQVAHLERALYSRADIDQAIGMVMYIHRTDPAGAWRILSSASQDTNLKLRVLAGAMGTLAAGGTPDDPSVATTAAALLKPVSLPVPPGAPSPAPPTASPTALRTGDGSTAQAAVDTEHA